ncbi:MAG: hypothetical protein IIY94_09595, partial [Oscillospiraceae bacterium]|nr:hypothetical protein [Oscillospiraceae bacterium]
MDSNTSIKTEHTQQALRRRKRRRIQTLLIVLVMLAGAGLLLYPMAADFWNRMVQTRAVMSYNA